MKFLITLLLSILTASAVTLTNGFGTNEYFMMLSNGVPSSFVDQYGFRAAIGMHGNQPVNNVVDFGAVNDGTTDSTSAFTNAFAASAINGLPVYIPSGNFICQALNVPAGVRAVFGDGVSSRVILKPSTVGFMWNAGSITCSFWGLRFSGGATNSFNSSGRSVGSRSGLRYSSTSQSFCRDLYFDGWDAVGLTVTGDTNIFTRIDNAQLENINIWNSYGAVEYKLQQTEYVRSLSFHIHDCFIGVYCWSANVEFSNFIIIDCQTGAYFSAGDGRIHQNFVNSSINHCVTALRIFNGSTGFNFANCRIMGTGIVSLENATGVHIHGCLFEAVTLNIDAACGMNVYNDNIFAGTAATYINDASGKLVAYDNHDIFSNTLAYPGGHGGYGAGPNNAFYFNMVPYKFPSTPSATNKSTVWMNDGVGDLFNFTCSIGNNPNIVESRVVVTDSSDFTYLRQLSLFNPIAHGAGASIYRVPSKFGSGSDSFLYDATGDEIRQFAGAPAIYTGYPGTGGAPNYSARWIDGVNLGTGTMQDNGYQAGIGATPNSSYRLNVGGEMRIDPAYAAAGAGFTFADGSKQTTAGLPLAGTAANSSALAGMSATSAATANTVVARDSSANSLFNHISLGNSAGDQTRDVYRIMGQYVASPQSSDMYVYPVPPDKLRAYLGSVSEATHATNSDNATGFHGASISLLCTNGLYYPVEIVIFGGIPTLHIGTPY